jgi:hypothetical protein
VLAIATLTLGACGKLQGFGGPEPPLATFQVAFNGDLGPLRPPGDTSERSLQVALVWGAQWLTEAFCILPPESDAAAAVIVAGCRDPFGFVPARVDTSAPIAVGGSASLPLLVLPTADLLVGDVTSRIGYASLVVYDDRDSSGTLELSQPHRTAFGSEGRRGGDGPPMDYVPDSADVIYGASFLTMTAPDQRVAYLEGAFVPSGFYPRSGCPSEDDPDDGFSVVGAGGFTAAAALAATAAGQLPPEAPASCSHAKPKDAVVSIDARSPTDLAEVGCDERTTDSSARYHEPPDAAPDLSGRVTACAHLPSFDAGTQTSLIQLVVAGNATDRCKGLTHYTLRGCRDDVACPVPDWDITASPPPWWPCSQ